MGKGTCCPGTWAKYRHMLLPAPEVLSLAHPLRPKQCYFFGLSDFLPSLHIPLPLTLPSSSFSCMRHGKSLTLLFIHSYTLYI